MAAIISETAADKKMKKIMVIAYHLGRKLLSVTFFPGPIAFELAE